MSISEHVAPDWEAFPFDAEIVLNAVPRGARTSFLHVSVSPTPANGGVRVMGKMANGGTGSVTLMGKIYAAKLPFVDRVIRVQYLGGTHAVHFELESYAFA
jgi:hypothetical protein